MKKKFKILISVGAAVLFFIVLAASLYLIFTNTGVHVSKITVSSENLPESFDGFKMVQISDLHNAEFGKDNKRLLRKIEKSSPDIIVITGDLIDCDRTDTSSALDFVERALKIAPCYFVGGNHEGRINAEESLYKELITLGVTILDDTSAEITLNGEKITLYGVHDPESLKGETYGYGEIGILEKRLGELDVGKGYSALLSHRPEGFDFYCETGFDLVLTGHVHGGQIRIPFIGGLYGPGQGLFPEYDSGLYQKGTTSMVVSRGLGNSSIPIRINNTPEIVVITLAN